MSSDYSDPEDRVFGIAAVIGAIIGLIAGFMLAGVGGAIIGGIIGAIIGVFAGGIVLEIIENWEDVIGCIVGPFLLFGLIWLIITLWNVGKP